jgi:hypothetical protein
MRKQVGRLSPSASSLSPTSSELPYFDDLPDSYEEVRRLLEVPLLAGECPRVAKYDASCRGVDRGICYHCRLIEIGRASAMITAIYARKNTDHKTSGEPEELGRPRIVRIPCEAK